MPASSTQMLIKHAALLNISLSMSFFLSKLAWPYKKTSGKKMKPELNLFHRVLPENGHVTSDIRGRACPIAFWAEQGNSTSITSSNLQIFERKGQNLMDLEDFNLKAKARIWQ
jgi:hypothetical protein